MTFTEAFKDLNKSKSNSLEAVLLNFSITVTLSAIGLLIFKFLWLRGDRFKLPDLDAAESENEKPAPVNSFGEYASKIFRLIRTQNVQQFIKRFGFEYYFYLKFHQMLALNFVMGFVVICVTVSIYSAVARSESGFTLRRIIGINDEGSKAYPVMNTLIMIINSVIVTFNLRRMNVSFQKALNDRVTDIQLEDQVRQSSPSNRGFRHNDLSLIMNTALLYGCSQYDEEQKVLIPYLKRLMKESRVEAHIQSHYTPSNHVELARLLADIKNKKLFYYHHPFMRQVLKAM